jgi:DNA-binding CsgD family transcriptional regulator
MPNSAHVRLSDVRAIFQIAGECRDLGDDPHAWRLHFARELGRLIGADLVFCVETEGCRARRPVDMGVVAWGWEHGFDLAGWSRAMAEFRQNPFYSLGLQRYFERFTERDGVVHSRQDLISNREWDRSFDDQIIHKTIGVDTVLWCFRSLPISADEQAGVIATREAGKRDFAGRDKALLAEAKAVITPLVGGALARFGEPSPGELPARTRRVLHCLLHGDGDKQVAARLTISPLTVNVHTKLIFRHFGVSSRAELLARWVRRGWGVGSWASPGDE